MAGAILPDVISHCKCTPRPSSRAKREASPARSPTMAKRDPLPRTGQTAGGRWSQEDLAAQGPAGQLTRAWPILVSTGCEEGGKKPQNLLLVGSLIWWWVLNSRGEEELLWLPLSCKCQMPPGTGQAARLQRDHFRELLAHSGIVRSTPNWEQLEDFTAGQDWLCVTHLHITNRVGSYSWIKGTPFMEKRTMEPH